MTLRPTIPSPQEVLEYLDRFTNYERVVDYAPGTGDFGTERIETLLGRLGDPQTAYPVLHVAGTKGKGSTSVMAARLLEAEGLRVGLYTSPHLEDVRERIQVAGAPIPYVRFCEAFALVQPAVEAMKREELRPTYFEILTAMAFQAFRESRVDVAVVEVGLGGRLDATNVVNLPVTVSAITTISKDHVKQLGNDLLSIAGEKAGILREETPVVLAPQNGEVMKALRARAKAKGAPVIEAGKDLRVKLREDPADTAPEAPQRLDIHTWRGRHLDVALPVLGAHQRVNAGLAVGLVESFLERQGRGPLSTETIRKAWRSLSLPCRQELVGRDPWVLLDGAHNPASAWALAETVQRRFPAMRRVLVFSAAADKEIPVMLRILQPLMDQIILTTNGSPRCMDLKRVSEHIAQTFQGVPHMEPEPERAFLRAKAYAGPDGLVIVAGSLYLAGQLRKQYGSVC